MEEFLNLKWGITGPHELDYGPDFIPEEEISSSYIFSESIQDKLTQDLVEATTTDKKQLVPGQQYKFKSKIKSYLDTNEQAKCLIALGLIRAGKKTTGNHERRCMDLYNNCVENILEENVKFLEFAKMHFLRGKKKKFRFKFQFLQNYATSLWIAKLKRCKDYKQLYTGIDMLPYSYNEDEESAEMLQVQNVLELGTLARFLRPTLLKPYHLKQGFIPKRRILYNSKQSVSKDQNIDKIIETTPTDIVISSSGLTKLLNFTKTNTSWDIPIVAKECKIQNKDGVQSTKNVVFIDKPLPSKSPSVFELNESCVKILMKTNFCDTEAFSFQNTETPIDVEEISEEKAQVTGESSSVSDTDKTEEETEETLTSDSNKRQVGCSEAEGSNKKVKLNDEGQNENDHQIHHNVSYRLWKLQLQNAQCELMKSNYQLHDVKVLVRSKVDGCENLDNGLLQPITVLPKLEYHLEFGAGIPTKDELVKEWTTAFFRPYSQVRRIRVHHTTGEVVAIENCNVQKIAHEAQTHYQHNMNLGLGMLYKIFSRLTNLTAGDYLLRHIPKDGAFITLLRETRENEDGVYNLHDEYDEDKCKISTNRVKTWHPIDVNFILPRHKVVHQMPGMFEPCLPRPNFVRKNKKSKRKKKKPKKKIVE